MAAGRPTGSSWFRAALDPWYRLAALVLGLFAALCAVVYGIRVGPCGSAARAGIWEGATTACGGLAMIGGLVCLGNRRWVAGFLAIAISAAAVTWAALTGFC